MINILLTLAAAAVITYGLMILLLVGLSTVTALLAISTQSVVLAQITNALYELLDTLLFIKQ